MKNNKIDLKRSIIYNSIGTFCYLFFQWVITFIIVWISGYKDAGKFAITMSIASSFYAISGFGMRNFQASDVSYEYSEKSYISSRAITCLLALIGTLIYSLTLGYDWYLILCINTYMVFKTSEAIVDVLHGSMQKKWLYKEIGISFLIRGFLSIIVFSVTLFVSKSLLLSIIFMAISVYFEIYFYDIKNYRLNFKKIGSTTKKEILKLLITCIPFATVTFLTNYLVTYPRIQIEAMLGNEILGIYTTFANPALIIQVAASFVFTPLITLFADLYKDNNNKEFYKTLIKTILITLFIGIIGYIAAKLIGGYIMGLLFGKDILPYSYLLCEVIIVSTLTAISWLLTSIITVFRKQWVLIIGSVSSLLVMMILAKDFIKNNKLSGVNTLLIICYLIMIVFYLLFTVYFLSKKDNSKKSKRSNKYGRKN